MQTAIHWCCNLSCCLLDCYIDNTFFYMNSHSFFFLQTSRLVFEICFFAVGNILRHLLFQKAWILFWYLVWHHDSWYWFDIQEVEKQMPRFSLVSAQYTSKELLIVQKCLWFTTTKVRLGLKPHTHCHSGQIMVNYTQIKGLDPGLLLHWSFGGSKWFSLGVL